MNHIDFEIVLVVFELVEIELVEIELVVRLVVFVQDLKLFENRNLVLQKEIL